MKLNSEAIARAGLRLLDENGLDGLTMRALAKDLGVQAPTLYWHVKNKQQLLDAMADIVMSETIETIEAPRRGVDWSEWLTALCHRQRAAMLAHRDGAKMLAGTNSTHPSLGRLLELTLTTLQDAGFPIPAAAQAFSTLYSFTVGYVIEEQSRTGEAYGDDNPYTPEKLAALIDSSRYPLAAQSIPHLFDVDSDAGFDNGIALIIDGMRAQQSRSSAAELP
ncbi:TetR/AcrR family transcriptional regulator C-terminal domain-containing protein [Nocardia sp. NPDC051030]|uniref:TetR/AcrR family transcriptional regulator C-terminal domain-containing protein n=1 Tax=Nocardia sp. NPDC051030 TaxID=3155162 RepID=UPI003437ADBC